MIIDYKLSPSHRPTDREVWLMSRRAETGGHDITRSMMKAFELGEIKYFDGKFYKFCRHCADFLPLEAFYENGRYVLGVGYICKACTSTRRRIKAYAVVSFITDNGIKDTNADIDISFNEQTKKILEERLVDNELTHKKDD